MPEPPAAPMRFDDLAVAPPERVKGATLRRVRNAASAVRTSVSRLAADAGRRSRPAVARARARAGSAATRAGSAAAAAWRSWSVALGAAGRAVWRKVRTAGGGRLAAVLALERAARENVGVAVASLIVLFGLSAGVAASRGAERSRLPAAAIVASVSRSADSISFAPTVETGESATSAERHASPSAELIAADSPLGAHAVTKPARRHRRLVATRSPRLVPVKGPTPKPAAAKPGSRLDRASQRP